MVIEPAVQHPEATAALIAALGPRKVFTDHATRLAHAHDNTRIAFLPEAVVKPADEADLARLLRLANEREVPVYVRGAGTGTTGASAPLRGGWVVSLTHWDKIEIDADAGMARVQPGAITGKINEEAARHGLFFPPDRVGHNFECCSGTATEPRSRIQQVKIANQRAVALRTSLGGNLR